MAQVMCPPKSLTLTLSEFAYFTNNSLISSYSLDEGSAISRKRQVSHLLEFP